MADTAATDISIKTDDDLLIPFHEAIKPRSEFRIGAEAEKFGVDATTGAALPYEGERSVVSVLNALIDRHAWKADHGRTAGPLIALSRAGASVTLEPGGQLELSGAAFENIHHICAEFSGHLAELRDISEELNLVWLGVGFHPFAKQADLPWVPKARYAVMRRYLPTKGEHAIDMMRRTATVQANFDYESEASAMRSLRISLKLSPVVTAMFANSPFYEGQLFGGRTYRGKVWLDVDPDRQGLLPKVLEKGTRFTDYIAWALDAPMFLVQAPRRGLREHRADLPEASSKDGFRAKADAHRLADAPQHALPRGAPQANHRGARSRFAAGEPHVCAARLVDGHPLRPARSTKPTSSRRASPSPSSTAVRSAIAEKALRATFRGKPLASLAERVLAIAEGGLERRAQLNKHGKDERVHLLRLRALVERGFCPGDVLAEGLGNGDGDLRREILARARI